MGGSWVVKNRILQQDVFLFLVVDNFHFLFFFWEIWCDPSLIEDSELGCVWQEGLCIQNHFDLVVEHIFPNSLRLGVLIPSWKGIRCPGLYLLAFFDLFPSVDESVRLSGCVSLLVSFHLFPNMPRGAPLAVSQCAYSGVRLCRCLSSRVSIHLSPGVPSGVRLHGWFQRPASGLQR